MTLNFKLKHPAKEKSSLYVHFKVNGESIKLYPNRVIETKFWSKSKFCLLSGHKNYQLINDHLKSFKDHIERIVLDFKKEGKEINGTTLRTELDKIYNPAPVENKQDFIAFIDAYIQNKKGTMPKRSVTDIIEKVKRFVILSQKLVSDKKFQEWNKLGTRLKSEFPLQAQKELPFSAINEDFLYSFRRYLNTTKKANGEFFSINYISELEKVLNQVINNAVNKKLVPYFQTELKRNFETADSVFCDWFELADMMKLKFDAEEELLEDVRNKFVFNCYLGLRQGDLKKIGKHTVRQMIINQEKVWLYYDHNNKTGKDIEFVLEPEAVTILQKYKFEFPYITDNLFNEKIKEVAMRAGINQIIKKRVTRGSEKGITKKVYIEQPKYMLISSHTCRRSFATNYYELGLDVPTIMSITNHTSERDFFKYIHKTSKVRTDIKFERMKAVRETRDKMFALNVA